MEEEEVEEERPRYRKDDDFLVGDDKQQLLLSDEDVDNELTLLRSNVDLRNLFLDEFFLLLAQENRSEDPTGEDNAGCLTSSTMSSS